MTITRLFSFGAALVLLAMTCVTAQAQQPAPASSAAAVEPGRASTKAMPASTRGKASLAHAASSGATAEIDRPMRSDGMTSGQRNFIDQYQNAITPPPVDSGR
jgi:hypothetical protein